MDCTFFLNLLLQNVVFGSKHSSSLCISILYDCLLKSCNCHLVVLFVAGQNERPKNFLDVLSVVVTCRATSRSELGNDKMAAYEVFSRHNQICILIWNMKVSVDSYNTICTISHVQVTRIIVMLQFYTYKLRREFGFRGFSIKVYMTFNQW